ncbi:hypothetical protein BOTNAR_0404g00030 [Botryotinia narcissicola]|uniref:Uncharacterized protein n=1 Tax=Botryotinia narcissicola TaxID=278944 RepID=A0A4Z1HU18_9HELO|nr:hypothetical protein BOTNAR_0404g00030 [Botryotinia narcissicola]
MMEGLTETYRWRLVRRRYEVGMVGGTDSRMGVTDMGTGTGTGTVLGRVAFVEKCGEPGGWRDDG